jgi:TIGR03009 family protein
MHTSHRYTVVLLALCIGATWMSTADGQTQEPQQAAAPGTQPTGQKPAGVRTAPRQAPRTAANPRTQYPPPANALPPGASPENTPPPSQQSTASQAIAAVGDTPPPGFALTPTQQQLLDKILERWEQQSEKISTFSCKFKRWEIDPAFGPEQNNYTLTDADGVIQYRSPDRGEYEVSKVIKWDPVKKSYLAYEEGQEHWMCDGDAIYEWDKRNKQLKVRPLPNEMKGKAITDGPLPFIFGAKAEQLKRRYWMRDVTPQKDIGKLIWLEARPRFQQDAANFQRVTVILNEKSCMPEALQIFPPGIVPDGDKVQANTAFRFMSPSVNNPLAIVKGAFLAPNILPPFWKRVVIDAPKDAAENPVPPAGAVPQARRPQPPAARK